MAEVPSTRVPAAQVGAVPTARALTGVPTATAVVPPWASFGTRVAAALIDFVILQCIMAAVQAMFFSMVMSRLDATTIILSVCGPLVIGGLLTLVYSVWLEASAWQGTVGKKILGLRVCTLDGQRIGFGRSMSRNIGKSFSALIFGVGYLMPLWTPKRQALHDKMAGCVVLRGHPAPRRILSHSAG